MATTADLIAYIAARRIDERTRVVHRIFHYQLKVDAALSDFTRYAYMRALGGRFGGYLGGMYADVLAPIIDPLDLADRLTAADIVTPAVGDQLSCWAILERHFACQPPRFYDVLWPRVVSYGVALFLDERQMEWELGPGPIPGIRQKSKPYHSLPANMRANVA